MPSPSDRRNKKQQQKRAQREKHKRKARALAQEARSRTGRLQRAARWPLRECRISRDFRTTGIAQVVVAREGAGGIGFAAFLVDLRCLGVKECFADVFPDEEAYEELLDRLSEPERVEVCAPELAAKVVLESERMARELGFRPAPEFELARSMLAGIDPAACAEELEHRTADGRPVYVAGDDDVRRILRRLEERLGPYGFHYVFPELGIGDAPEMMAGATEEWTKLLEHADPDLRAFARLRITDLGLVLKLARYAALRFGLDLFAEARAAHLADAPPVDEEFEVPYFHLLELPWALVTFRPGPRGAEEEATVADLFLAERGAELAEIEREILGEYRRRPLGFFAVDALDPGRSLRLRDLLTGREATVVAPQISTVVQPGSVVYGRVATVAGVSFLAGFDPAILPPIVQIDVIDLREALAGEGQFLDEETVARMDVPLRATWHAWQGRGPEDEDEELEDDEGIGLLHKRTYAVDCDVAEAFDALADMCGYLDREEVLRSERRDAEGRLVGVGFPCTPAGAAGPLTEEDAIGALLLRPGRIFVITPTEAYAEEIGAGIEARLGDRARRGPLESLPSLEEGPPAPEPRAELARRWLDEPHPDLRDQTPREAAHTPAGRERLSALLLDLEAAEPDEPEMPDVAVIRRELGLEPAAR